MQIEIQAQNFSLTRSLRTQIEQQLESALKTCYRHIKHIMVRLSDVNGPRGGNDKRCHLELFLPGQAVVVVKTEADLYAAINRAASRASRNAMRLLRRRRSINRVSIPADIDFAKNIS
jgi:putative sigma-54 modulation protein